MRVGLFGKVPVGGFLGTKAVEEEVGEVVIPVADWLPVLAVDNGPLLRWEEAHDRKVVCFQHGGDDKFCILVQVVAFLLDVDKGSIKVVCAVDNRAVGAVPTLVGV